MHMVGCFKCFLFLFLPPAFKITSRIPIELFIGMGFSLSCVMNYYKKLMLNRKRQKIWMRNPNILKPLSPFSFLVSMLDHFSGTVCVCVHENGNDRAPLATAYISQKLYDTLQHSCAKANQRYYSTYFFCKNLFLSDDWVVYCLYWLLSTYIYNSHPLHRILQMSR